MRLKKKEINVGTNSKTIEDAFIRLVNRRAMMTCGWHHPDSHAGKGFEWSLNKDEIDELSGQIISFNDGKVIMRKNKSEPMQETLKKIASRVDDEYWEWAVREGFKVDGDKENYYSHKTSGNGYFGINS